MTTELFLLGLTGLYCAGKNYAAALLERRDFPVLDVDKLGHTALESERAAVIARFGTTVLAEDGSLSRRRLAEKVFARAEELAALEAIVHPAANALTEAWVLDARRLGKRAAVINAALLHRSPVFARLNAIIVVKAPLPVRAYRAWKRDGLSAGEVFRRFFRQRQFTAQYFKARADIYTIGNSGFPGSNARLERQLDAVLEKTGLRETVHQDLAGNGKV
jgi:dephospho-CoA kinase